MILNFVNFITDDARKRSEIEAAKQEVIFSEQRKNEIKRQALENRKQENQKNNEFRKQSQTTERCYEQICSVKKACNLLTAEVEEMKNNVNVQIGKAQNFINQNVEYRDERRTITNRMEASQSKAEIEIKNQKATLAELKMEHSELDKSSKSSIVELKNRILKLSDELGKLDVDVVKSTSLAESKNDELSRLEATVQSLKNDIDKIKTANTKAEDENKLLEEELVEKKNTIEKISADNFNIEKDIEEIIKQIENFFKEIRGFNTKMLDLSSDWMMKFELETLESKVSDSERLEKQLQQKASECAEKEANLSRTQQEYDEVGIINIY